MSGLEKITAQILEDGRMQADRILAEAMAKADGILNEARAEAGALLEEQEERAVHRRELQADRLRSAELLQRRQAILAAKQDVIARMLDAAYAALLSEEDSRYFDRIKNMLSRFALAQNGAVYFNKKDLERMPEGFPEVIEKTAALKGGSLVLMTEPKEIDGGFVLVYGGVEENCSFRAILDSRRDELTDQVHKWLFL